MNIQPKAALTFSKCLEMGLDSHVETISKVADVAGKEFSIEQVWRMCMLLTYMYIHLHLKSMKLLKVHVHVALCIRTYMCLFLPLRVENVYASDIHVHVHICN